MFASRYLDKNQFVPRIKECPEQDTHIIIVIPCFNEPDILLTLQSLTRCRKPEMPVEVIVLINHSEAAPREVKDYNEATKHELDRWIHNTAEEGMKFHAVGPVELRKKWAGVGMARKAGMDEAVARFNQLNKPGGIVLSLDADTLAEENYLVEVERYFRNHPSHAGATISFSHQTEGLSDKLHNGIRLYELYMDYYKKAMDFTGYPYPMYTVGSAIAVTADAYVKRGGMNRRQAGEDFYFLQNLVQVGPVGEINSTTIHPSARISGRVPFGTGMTMKKWMNDEEDLTLTYNFRSFIDLKQFFALVPSLFKADEKTYRSFLDNLPGPVSDFLKEDEFYGELAELNENCSSQKTFIVRFYHKFNAFKILKYLNYTHERYYQKAHLELQMQMLEEHLR